MFRIDEVSAGWFHFTLKWEGGVFRFLFPVW